MSSTWLSLLVSEAPADGFDELRMETLRALRSPAERAAVEDEFHRALQVMSLLAERRQRAAELAVLNDLAGRLTALRDLDELLQEVVAQARRLLGVDLAYLALAEGDLVRIAVTEGSLGPRLRGVTLDRNSGIAGRVVATGEPFWTDDYLAEVGIRHVNDVDAIASAEHLGSILGVPLRLRDRVTGVLFAAERGRRPFTDAEVELLCSLAAHAAVAIENARLFAEVVERTNVIQRSVVLHEQLTEIVLRGGGLDDVLRVLADVVGAQVDFRDRDEPFAASASFAEPAARRAITEPLADGSWRAATPVTAGEDYLGCLIATHPAQPDDAVIRLLERGALATALVVVAERTRVEAHLRAAGELIDLLVGRGNHDRAMVRRRAAAAGLRLDEPHCVVALEPLHADAGATRAIALGAASRMGGVAGERSGLQVMVVPSDDPHALLATVRRLRTTATVAIGGPGGEGALADSYEEACRAIGLLRALDRTGQQAVAADLGLYRFLFSEATGSEATRFVHSVVGPLLDYDSKRGTQLAATVDAFLAEGRHHTAAARRLNIHPNTLYQRLERVASVLGPDWRQPDRSFEVQAALHLHRLANAIAP